ncbi:MAG TPA: DUF998 domain-containing protein [Lapillicoccus sp.]|nr:DUF998 domain-containing protein [Lapillicoccus sp.]
MSPLTTLEDPVPTSAPAVTSARRGRWIPVAGMAGFAVAVAVGTVLAPDSYDSIRDTMSVLAAVDNPYGEIMVAGFLALAVGLAATAVGLWRGLPVWVGRIAAIEVAVAAVATAVAGLARVACNPALPDCQSALEADVPLGTLVHGRAALFVFAPLVLAGFTMAVATWMLRERRLALLCVGLGLVNVALVLLVEDAGTSVSGLLQRVFLLTSVGLPVFVQWWVAQRGTTDPPDHDRGGSTPSVGGQSTPMTCRRGREVRPTRSPRRPRREGCGCAGSPGGCPGPSSS